MHLYTVAQARLEFLNYLMFFKRVNDIGNGKIVEKGQVYLIYTQCGGEFYFLSYLTCENVIYMMAPEP